jgi:hypothetical protein
VKRPWDFASSSEEIEWLQREVERLRAALDEIRGDELCQCDARAIARAALTEEVTPIQTDP